jgi:hypothetical protein
MMEAQPVSETLIFNSISTRLIASEDFIAFICRDVLRLSLSSVTDNIWLSEVYVHFYPTTDSDSHAYNLQLRNNASTLFIKGSYVSYLNTFSDIINF